MALWWCTLNPSEKVVEPCFNWSLRCKSQWVTWRGRGCYSPPGTLQPVPGPSVPLARELLRRNYPCFLAGSEAGTTAPVHLSVFRWCFVDGNTVEASVLWTCV